MEFEEIRQYRLTGISTPIGGVSWDPPEPEVTKAQRIITYLEDRRVLYNPTELEVPEHCVRSVLNIRSFLTVEMGELRRTSELFGNLNAMRAACRKFLDTVGSDERIIPYGFHDRHYASWVFNSALGELRGVFGIHLAQIAAKYGLDIMNPLDTIPPAAAEDE